MTEYDILPGPPRALEAVVIAGFSIIFIGVLILT